LACRKRIVCPTFIDELGLVIAVGGTVLSEQAASKAMAAMLDRVRARSIFFFSMWVGSGAESSVGTASLQAYVYDRLRAAALASASL